MNLARGLDAEEEHVRGTPARPGGYAEHLGIEAEAIEARRVRGVWPCRPDREHPSRVERVPARTRADVAVEALVLHLRERPRAIVDVENDHVELASRARDDVEGISQHDLAARIVAG